MITYCDRAPSLKTLARGCTFPVMKNELVFFQCLWGALKKISTRERPWSDSDPRGKGLAVVCETEMRMIRPEVGVLGHRLI